MHRANGALLIIFIDHFTTIESMVRDSDFFLLQILEGIGLSCGNLHLNLARKVTQVRIVLDRVS